MGLSSRYICTLLIMVCSTAVVLAQTPAPKPQPAHKFQVTSEDIAATFTVERAKVQSSSCSCFWLKGGSADGAITFYRGLGFAANLTAEHANNITPGVNLGKLSFMVGPRYTLDTTRYTRHLMKKRATRVFGEALFGGVHGFDSVFPGANGSSFSAGAFSEQLGIGSDIDLHKGFGIRPLEIDYVHTTLPNNGSNNQNDLRLAFGLYYRITSK